VILAWFCWFLLYNLYIHFAVILCCEGGLLDKLFRGVRFKPELYYEFKRLADSDGFTVTRAFERFMEVCLGQGGVVFPDYKLEGLEAEARVLLDWLRKGKRFYRYVGKEEVNVVGRLVFLLTRVRDAGLRGDIEAELKKSVSVPS